MQALLSFNINNNENTHHNIRDTIRSAYIRAVNTKYKSMGNKSIAKTFF